LTALNLSEQNEAPGSHGDEYEDFWLPFGSPQYSLVKFTDVSEIPAVSTIKEMSNNEA
jgi:hypothetical protein